ALRPAGTVAAWGDNASGQASVPAGLNNVVAVAAGTFHGLALRAPTLQLVAVGADAGSSAVRAYNAFGGSALLDPFPGFAGGVRVATGDVNADGVEDLVAGMGPGGQPLVKVFSGVDGSQMAAFLAYGSAF